VISTGEIDYSAIVSPNPTVAEVAFEKVYAVGNPQAKAIALTGLKRLGSPKFKELAVLAESSNDQVATMTGCFYSHRSSRDIAVQMEKQSA
jgi:hypothetical protein